MVIVECLHTLCNLILDTFFNEAENHNTFSITVDVVSSVQLCITLLKKKITVQDQRDWSAFQIIVTGDMLGPE